MEYYCNSDFYVTNIQVSTHTDTEDPLGFDPRPSSHPGVIHVWDRKMSKPATRFLERGGRGGWGVERV